MASSRLQCDVQDGKGDNSDVETDEEGIDMDNDNVRHFSSEDDVDMDTGRAGSPLRRPIRSRQRITAQGSASGTHPCNLHDDVSQGTTEPGTPPAILLICTTYSGSLHNSHLHHAAMQMCKLIC